MKIGLCLSVCLTLLAGGGQALADAGDLPGGAFIAHAPPNLQYTNSPPSGSWCTEYSQNYTITSCEQQDNGIESQGMAVWYVLCAWAESKEWCGTEFGLGEYDEESFLILEHGPCFPSAGLTIPTAGWPGPSEGIALTTTDTAWSGNFQPIYWMAGYVYAEDVIPLSPDPANGFGGWARCEDQAEFEADDFGGMGLLTGGIFACPEAGQDGAEGGAEEDVVEGDIVEIEGMETLGVCCLGSACYVCTGVECEDIGGEFDPDLQSCEGASCGNQDNPTIRRVCQGGPYPKIQDAVNAADPHDIIQICDGYYAGSGNVNVDLYGKDLVIESESGNAESVIIDCEAVSGVRAFWIHGDQTGATKIKDLTIRNGRAAGT